MRKFVPRLLNVIIFLACLICFIPTQVFLSCVETIKGLTQVFNYPLDGFKYFITNSELWFAIKVLYFPIGLLLISVIFLVISSVDRNKKEHNNMNSIPLENLIYQPLLYFSLLSSILGIIYSLFNIGSLCNILTFEFDDFMGFSYFIQNVILHYSEPYVVNFDFINLIYYGITLVLSLLLLVIFKNNYKKGFLNKFFSLLFVLIVTIASSKGYSLFNRFGHRNVLDVMLLKYNGTIDGLLIIDSLNFNNPIVIITFVCTTIALLILYIIISSLKASKNNKIMKELYSPKKPVIDIGDDKMVSQINVTPSFEDLERDIEEEAIKIDSIKNNIAPVEGLNISKDSIFNIPKVDESLIENNDESQEYWDNHYQEHNLNQIYNYNYDFKNCKMILNPDGSTDYFKNKIKFLTLSNDNKKMEFRLNLDEAISLIIKYPLILKDRYEDHKIWFKIEDSTNLDNEILCDLIIKAYNFIK